MSDLHWLTIREAGERLEARDASASELLDAVLARIAETEPHVHAFVTVMEDSARAEAEAADRRAGAGERLGPLDGIPIGVKDLCHTKGVVTSAGSKVLEGFVPKQDAVVVERLRTGGAVIVGKTVTHEFAYGQDIPPTRNSWDHRCYPGGSSAGSGVSVAVGSAFGAIGTDTGGSIRVPASVNGIVGLKPTAGRVSRRGVVPMSPTLDTVGPLARTVEDCALILNVIAGGDDATVIDEPVPDYASGLTERLDGLRVGVERSYFFYEGVRDDVRAAAEEAIDTLGQQGAKVVEVPMIDHIELASAVGITVLVADTSEWHRTFLREHGDLYVQATRIMLQLGELVPATAYVRAQKVRSLVRDGLRNAFEQHEIDALVAPTIPLTTMPVEMLSVDLTGTGETALSGFLHHCFLANVTGVPAMTVPIGFSDELLPIGLQLYGRPFGEAALFRIAHAYQEATDWHRRHPEVGRVVA
ncbi:MAG: amidase family protein [Gaiellaceae bacterium MAG52_C11]|nr:amidase family protein [Candidatus Gaiellasilicea maunaloa]